MIISAVENYGERGVRKWARSYFEKIDRDTWVRFPRHLNDKIKVYISQWYVETDVRLQTTLQDDGLIVSPYGIGPMRKRVNTRMADGLVMHVWPDGMTEEILRPDPGETMRSFLIRGIGKIRIFGVAWLKGVTVDDGRQEIYKAALEGRFQIKTRRRFDHVEITRNPPGPLD